jgi:hypothetical protein
LRDVISDFEQGVDHLDLRPYTKGVLFELIEEEGAAFTKGEDDIFLIQARWDQQQLGDGSWRTVVYLTGDEFTKVKPMQFELSGQITLTADDIIV